MKSWIAEFDRIKEDGMKTLDSLRPRPKISFNELEKKIHALEVLEVEKDSGEENHDRDLHGTAR